MTDTAQIREYIDIPYVPNPDGKFHKLDLYVPERQSSPNASKLPPLLVFVHGGAWRSYVPSCVHCSRSLYQRPPALPATTIARINQTTPPSHVVLLPSHPSQSPCPITVSPHPQRLTLSTPHTPKTYTSSSSSYWTGQGPNHPPDMIQEDYTWQATAVQLIC